MRKTSLAIVLGLVLIFGYAPSSSRAGDMMSESGGTSDSHALIGATVKNLQDEHLGAIAAVVPGPEERTAFAVLSYWVSDDTHKRVAVPYGALSCEERNCTLSASRETLDSAPAFISEDGLTEPKMAEDIYRYFGVQPYWTEE